MPIGNVLCYVFMYILLSESLTVKKKQTFNEPCFLFRCNLMMHDWHKVNDLFNHIMLIPHQGKLYNSITGLKTVQHIALAEYRSIIWRYVFNIILSIYTQDVVNQL